jgi:hypothetical protein
LEICENSKFNQLTLYFPALFLANAGVVDKHRIEVGAIELHNNRLFNGIIAETEIRKKIIVSMRRKNSKKFSLQELREEKTSFEFELRGTYLIYRE